MKEDTIFVLDAEQERQQLRQSFVSDAWNNPALRFDRYRYTLSTISIDGSDDRYYSTDWLEEGQGLSQANVMAHSHVLFTPHSRLWGHATYNRGRRKDVKWNETSDFELLYPYVAADSIGGNMTTETYRFNGGYAHRLGHWTLGAEFSYRALLEFRRIDPRPRNVVADLQARLGASYHIGKRYVVALQAEGQKYRQRDGIKYFDELGVSKTFHLQGLGSSYKRFDGTRTSVDYEGHYYGGALSLMPVQDRSGIMAFISGRHSVYRKSISTPIDLCLNKLSENSIHGTVGWQGNSSSLQWGVKGYFNLALRKGKEVLYGEATGNTYPVLTERKAFKRQDLAGGIQGFAEYQHSALWQGGLMLQTGYSSRNERQLSTLNHMNYSHINCSLLLSSTWRLKRDILVLHVGGMYRPHLTSDLQVNAQTAIPYSANILQQNFDHFSADNVTYHLALRWSRQIFKNKLFHLEAAGGQAFENHGRSGYMYRLSIGTSF